MKIFLDEDGCWAWAFADTEIKIQDESGIDR
jgi:hypothetical protein